MTLFSAVFAFQGQPAWAPGPRPPYMRVLVAYSLVVGLCAAIALAPTLQHGEGLFPIPATAAGTSGPGHYEVLRTRTRARAAVADLAGCDAAAVAYAQEQQHAKAVADCQPATTTMRLALCRAGTAVPTGACTWSFDRNRSRKGGRADFRPPTGGSERRNAAGQARAGRGGMN
ncbi:hypothetical protein [Streptomyces sp. NRRL F-2580]|uniref:hypothetical protein n=1 Tax=Streptomyces sp. NRRL F-2580 TaxID=1463841 RepID=UPI0007C4B345|nr:hypothetical protein [Streptomyces sp. NRRL F-2580]